MQMLRVTEGQTRYNHFGERLIVAENCPKRGYVFYVSVDSLGDAIKLTDVILYGV